MGLLVPPRPPRNASEVPRYEREWAGYERMLQRSTRWNQVMLMVMPAAVVVAAVVLLMMEAAR